MLLKLLITRDLTVRYKRSILGVWWSLLNPIMTTLVLYFVFNSIFMSAMPTRISFIPYLLSGILLVTFFNQGLNAAADSIANGSGLLNKQYVRPEIFAISGSVASAVNFCFGLIPLTIVIYISDLHYQFSFLLIIPLILLLVLFTTGLGFILAIMYLHFDDLRPVVSVFLLLLQYLVPVFYPIAVLGDTTQQVIRLNPLNSFLEILRDISGQSDTSTSTDWLFISVTALVTFFIGAAIFEKSWSKAVVRL